MLAKKINTKDSKKQTSGAKENDTKRKTNNKKNIYFLFVNTDLLNKWRIRQPPTKLESKLSLKKLYPKTTSLNANL